MKIKTLSCVMGMLLPLFSLRAQEIKPLKIGDTVPDLVLHNVINYKDSVIRLSDFKDKLVILDFGSTWCGPCIAAVPKFQQLKKEFNGKIDFIFVTQEGIEGVKRYLLSQAPKSLSFPFVCHDSILKGYFPHTSIPHEVWISRDGIVVASTYPQYVTKENIARVLRDNKINLPIKSKIIPVSDSIPLVKILDTENKGAFFYSILTGYQADRTKKMIYTLDSSHGFQKIYAANFELLYLCLKAYGLPMDYPRSHMIIKMDNPNSLFYDRDKDYPDKWRSANCFSYECELPLHSGIAGLEIQMQCDLKNYLGIWGQISKAPVKCWVIRNNTSIKLPLAPTTPESNSKGHKISDLIYALNNLSINMPVVDSSTNSNSVYTDFYPTKTTSLAELRQHLIPLGYSIDESTEVLPLFILNRLPGFIPQN